MMPRHVALLGEVACAKRILDMLAVARYAVDYSRYKAREGPPHVAGNLAASR
jgi:hypothetical protein